MRVKKNGPRLCLLDAGLKTQTVPSFQITVGQQSRCNFVLAQSKAQMNTKRPVGARIHYGWELEDRSSSERNGPKLSRAASA
jgi:hypothetical protein